MMDNFKEANQIGKKMINHFFESKKLMLGEAYSEDGVSMSISIDGTVWAISLGADFLKLALKHQIVSQLEYEKLKCA